MRCHMVIMGVLIFFEDIPQTVIQIWFQLYADPEYQDEDLLHDRDCFVLALNQTNTTDLFATGARALPACTGNRSFTDEFISWGALVSSVLGLCVETLGFFAAWKRLRWEKVCWYVAWRWLQYPRARALPST